MASNQPEPLRVGYVPEHFSTPLHLAQLHGQYGGTTISFHPYPSGTGHMIQSLRADEIDVAIGLTEGWIAGIKGPLKADWYKVIGQTAAIMSFVLALQQHGWIAGAAGGQPPFEFVVLDNFKNLRDAVNSGAADAFMWEHFTSKKFYDTGEIKRIGEIYTPWPSWLITARSALVEARDPRLGSFLDGVNWGIAHFRANPEQSIEWITANLEYSEEDAKEWRKGVRFVDDVKRVDLGIVEKVIDTLKGAGVVEHGQDIDGVVVLVD
ncbi:hypothetical protein DRE_06295 [Drechslerella stenobrocha 248]|uniref:Ca3427-like PBP 2 domain-containing protein n=1 Tax=Drechslerella stenobrocha 248 TaxID=1043628 RepID=W7I7S9_9PEZI|nr:hypothetical protein DRE_06295 [Drechslerella stenobrocha 248]